ncbi:MAG: dTDP-4-dehydrorhamnose reductase [Pseudomonadota bacterium]
MRILLTGKNGQIGYELERSLQGLGEIVALDRRAMDLADLDQVRDVIRRVKPDLIINPAAYTAVDQAETDTVLAMRINGEAPGVMAQEAKLLGAALIHYSTDYVFDGTKQGPYTEDDPTCPLNSYGRSKLAGEQAIAATGVDHLILRTSWVYGRRGKNFLLTIQRLAQQRERLAIVSDQFGAPTWCRTIADSTAHIVARHGNCFGSLSGIYHLTAQGRTSWHGFAGAILAHPDCPGKPQLDTILASEYPLPAPRPANSSLSCARLIDTFGTLPQWDDALALCLG